MDKKLVENNTTSQSKKHEMVAQSKKMALLRKLSVSLAGLSGMCIAGLSAYVVFFEHTTGVTAFIPFIVGCVGLFVVAVFAYQCQNPDIPSSLDKQKQLSVPYIDYLDSSLKDLSDECIKSKLVTNISNLLFISKELISDTKKRLTLLTSIDTVFETKNLLQIILSYQEYSDEYKQKFSQGMLALDQKPNNKVYRAIVDAYVTNPMKKQMKSIISVEGHLKGMFKKLQKSFDSTPLNVYLERYQYLCHRLEEYFSIYLSTRQFFKEDISKYSQWMK